MVIICHTNWTMIIIIIIIRFVKRQNVKRLPWRCRKQKDMKHVTTPNFKLPLNLSKLYRNLLIAVTNTVLTEI